MEMEKVKVRNFHLLMKMELSDIREMDQIKELFHLEQLKKLHLVQYYLVQYILNLLEVMQAALIKGGKVMNQIPGYHHGNLCVLLSSPQQWVFHLIYYLEAEDNVSFWIIASWNVESNVRHLHKSFLPL